MVLPTAQRLEVLVLADEQMHDCVQPVLAVVARRIITVAEPQALLPHLWAHMPEIIVIATPERQDAVPALCHQLRQYFPSPILIIGQNASEDMRIAWLDSGADDVLTLGSAGLAELPARCYALRRRVYRQQRRDPASLRLHTLSMQLDITERRLYLVNGHPVDLSGSLTRFLAIFFNYGEALVPTEALGHHMFGADSSNLQRRLYTLSQALSQRTSGASGPQPRIERVRGAGYRLVLVGVPH